MGILDKQKLASQAAVDNACIRFSNCVIIYKLKDIETQATRYRRRKIGKTLGYSFKPLRICHGNQNLDETVFQKCIFNPSDKAILQEHVMNLESLRLEFSNCKFLRRQSKLQERVSQICCHYFKKYVKFSGANGCAIVNSETIRLKDLPTIVEYILQNHRKFL